MTPNLTPDSSLDDDGEMRLRLGEFRAKKESKDKRPVLKPTIVKKHAIGHFLASTPKPAGCNKPSIKAPPILTAPQKRPQLTAPPATLLTRDIPTAVSSDLRPSSCDDIHLLRRKLLLQQAQRGLAFQPSPAESVRHLAELDPCAISIRVGSIAELTSLVRELNDDFERRALHLSSYQKSVVEAKVPIIDHRKFDQILAGMDPVREMIDKISSLANHFVEAQGLKHSLEESMARLSALFQHVDSYSNALLLNIIP